MADDILNPQDDTGGNGDSAATTTDDKTVDDQTADDKGGAPDKTVLTDGADGPQGAPETYADFTLPDGMEVNEAMLDAAKPVFKDIGLTQIQAQTIMDMYAGQITTQETAANDSYKQQVQGWKDEIKADKTIGGENLDKSVAVAKRALDAHGSPGLIQLLDSTGLGNHPDVIRFFHKVGLTLAEDDPGGDTTPTGDDKSAAEIMYGSN